MNQLLNEQITIVEIGDSISASVCGMFLRHLGATVIKVEPATGSPSLSQQPLMRKGKLVRSAMDAYLNRGKTIFTGELATDDDNSVVQLIKEKADAVLLSGTDRDVLSSTGYSTRSIRDLKSNLVVGRVSLFGDAEPYCDLHGGELQVLALGGLLHMLGERGKEPIRLGGYQAQYSAGLSLFAGVVLALLQRSQTNNGSEVVTSVFASVAYVEWKGASHYQNDGVVLTRGSQTGPLIFPCNDGFSAFYYRSSDWPAVKKLFSDVALDRPEFATQELRDQNRQDLYEAIAAATRQKSKLDLYHEAQALGIPIGYMASVGDLLDSKQYESRNFLETIDLDEFGSGVVPGAPWKLQRAEEASTAEPHGASK